MLDGMKWPQNAYTHRFNVRRRLWGRLFGDRYKSIPVEGGGLLDQSVVICRLSAPGPSPPRSRMS